jgi:hypothetical protein
MRATRNKAERGPAGRRPAATEHELHSPGSVGALVGAGVLGAKVGAKVGVWLGAWVVGFVGACVGASVHLQQLTPAGPGHKLDAETPPHCDVSPHTPECPSTHEVAATPPGFVQHSTSAPPFGQRPVSSVPPVHVGHLSVSMHTPPPPVQASHSPFTSGGTQHMIPMWQIIGVRESYYQKSRGGGVASAVEQRKVAFGQSAMDPPAGPGHRPDCVVPVHVVSILQPPPSPPHAEVTSFSRGYPAGGQLSGSRAGESKGVLDGW